MRASVATIKIRTSQDTRDLLSWTRSLFAARWCKARQIVHSNTAGYGLHSTPGVERGAFVTGGKRRAFITGISGQDGSYLAELLLTKGYEVHGLLRRASTFNTRRLDPIYRDPHEPNPALVLHYGDLTDGVSLTNLLRELNPDEIYHLGAQSHVRVSFEIPEYTAQTT